jgi:hypothetical protein
MSFLFFLLQNWRAGEQSCLGRLVPKEGGRRWKKGVEGNTVQMLRTHVCKWKNKLLKLFQEWGRGG